MLENADMSGSSRRRIRSDKQSIRSTAQENRRCQDNKDLLSLRIMETCLSLPAVRQAESLMLYMHVRDEVRTGSCLPKILAGTWKVIVPWCTDAGNLELFILNSMDELEVGRFGILEPARKLRCLAEKRVEVAVLDAILVPGVAFDRSGGRLGHGYGYYDRLLQQVRCDCLLAGLAWECQLFPEIPMDEHDVFMNCVVTEATVHQGRQSLTNR